MKFIRVAVPALMLMACGSTEITLSPKGSDAEIILMNDTVMTAELVGFSDASLFCSSDTLLEIPLGDVRSIRLNIDESRDWVMPVVFCQALPSAALVGVDDKMYALLGFFITAVTWTAFEASGPRVYYERPWSEREIGELRLHARHPEGLPPGVPVPATPPREGNRE